MSRQGGPTWPTRNPGYRWVILAVAFLGIFGAAGLSRFGYSAVLPDMQKALELSGAESGSLASWNLAGYTLMALVGGFLASRFGARLVVTTGMVVTAIGMLLTGLSGGLVAASAARLLTGLGNGVVMAPSVVLMSSWFGTRQVGLASAIASSGTGLGLVVAGPVAPRIIESAGADGWRIAWYLFAGVALLMAIVTLVLERDRPFQASHENKPPAPRRSVRKDLLNVLRSKYAWHLGSIYFLYGFAYLIYYTFFQKRLTADLGLSTATAGNLFLIAGAASLVFGMLWGAASDRIGRGRALALVFAADAVAACLFAFDPGMAGLVISAVIFGSGVFSVPGLMGAACGDHFDTKLAYASFGFVTVFIGLGQTVGPYVGGLLEDVFGSLGPSYLLSAGIFVLAGFTAFLLPDARKQTNPARPGRTPV
ncbi:MAG: YbfB/YjiJ family MFS transporter [Actinobacteria bacterium]|nr:YbfB/YjiJ family MFS transporter [Actinomycetota bacterium]